MWRSFAAICLVIGLPACSARNTGVAPPPVAAEGCPMVLITRTGGLGFESQNGLLAAVWPSGAILRAGSLVLPRGGHVVGTVPAADLNDLVQLVRSNRIWEQPTGSAALDMPDDAVILRRGGEVRRWVETPGFTSTPVVSEVRTRVFSLPIQEPRRVTEPVDEIWTCQSRN